MNPPELAAGMPASHGHLPPQGAHADLRLDPGANRVAIAPSTLPLAMNTSMRPSLLTSQNSACQDDHCGLPAQPESGGTTRTGQRITNGYVVTVQFITRTLPDLTVPAAVPDLGPLIFQQRYERLERAREAAGLDWVSSPFFRGSPITLKPGYAIQQDVVPVPRHGAAMLNMEDGFVLGDDDLKHRAAYVATFR
jgi:hypothetical protein